MKRYFPIFGLLLLSACATPEPTPEPVALKPEAPAATPVAKESIRSQPLKHLLGRSLTAMPETPLEVRARCNFKDVAGGHGRMDLQVNKAEVKRFVAEVTIPKQGLCRFDMKRYFPIFGLLLLSACATPDPTPEPVALKPETPAVTPVAKESIRSQPLKHLLGRSLKAMPETPLEVRTRCNFKDVAGGHGRMDLQVNKAEVKRFVAEVTIPKQGLCRFDMKHFEQTAKLPNVVLSDRETACTVRMWEQDKGVTVAFNGCQAKCSGDAFSYLWPILVDTRSGRCA